LFQDDFVVSPKGFVHETVLGREGPQAPENEDIPGFLAAQHRMQVAMKIRQPPCSSPRR
jgi:hypothetical protein